MKLFLLMFLSNLMYEFWFASKFVEFSLIIRPRLKEANAHMAQKAHGQWNKDYEFKYNIKNKFACWILALDWLSISYFDTISEIN